MSNYNNDQASGLRRLMTKPEGRIISMLCASSLDIHTKIVSNLASAFTRKGVELLLVHAGSHQSDVYRKFDLHNKLSIMGQVSANRSIDEAVVKTDAHCSVAKLLPGDKSIEHFNDIAVLELSTHFSRLCSCYQVALVDVILSDVGKLPIEPFGSGEIVIYLDKNPESIKVAYSMIKIMCNQLGTRNFGILMFDMNQSTAKTVFRNLSHVARNNLHVELELVGYLGVETQLGLVSQFGDGAMDNFPIVSDTVKREANLVNNETRNSNFVSSLSGMNHSRLLEA